MLIFILSKNQCVIKLILCIFFFFFLKKNGIFYCFLTFVIAKNLAF